MCFVEWNYKYLKQKWVTNDFENVACLQVTDFIVL